MSDHIPKLQMERFCARALTTSELAISALHLASCKTCQQVFRETQKSRRDNAPVSFTLAPEKWLRHEHLSFEQLSPYVYKGLDNDEREIIDLHLSLCRQCREDVRSFQSIHQHTASDSVDRYSPDVLPTWREKLLIQWGRLAEGWKPVYAAMMVLVFVSIIAIITLLIERNRTVDQLAGRSQPAQLNEAVTTPTVNSSNVSNQVNNDIDTSAVAPATKASQSKRVEDSAQTNAIPSSSPMQNVIPEPRRSSVAESVALIDGQGRVIINNSGNLTGMDSLPRETQQTIKEVLLAQNITKPAVLSEIDGETSALRGTPERARSFKLLSPARTVIANDRPTFTWAPIVGATNYRVQVVDSHNHEVTNSGELPSTSTQWTLLRPLARGIVYTWIVTAMVNDSEVIAPSTSEPEMKFKVLDEESLREISTLQRRTPSHLALGILYARAGMRAEAEREFQMLVKQNPNSPVAKQLLRSIHAWQ